MKILIIDANNTMHRAHHAYKNLNNYGKPVDIIFGMPSIVNGLINQFKPDDIYLCWDGNRSKQRLELLKDYKKGRRVYTDEERKSFDRQKEQVMKLFYYLGVKQLKNEEMEADDMIYALTRKLKKDKSNHITIISTDKDFHQLLCSNVKIYNTHKRALIHNKNLKNHFGYTKEQCIEYLSLVGDDSDNIPGVKGVGHITALGLLNGFGNVENFMNSDKNFPRVNKENIPIRFAINQALIDLKYFYNKHIKGTKPFHYIKSSKPKLRRKKLFKLCDRYSIKQFKKVEFLNNYK